MAKRAVLRLVPAGAPAGDTELSRTLIERAYHQLRDDIVEGRLGPGERLRVEHLRSRYGVGAGTLREAITRLATDALVVAEGQRGFRVAAATMADLEDLTRLRLHIEIDALRQSIRHGGASWRAAVEAAYEQLSSVEQPLRPEMRPQWEQLNTRFHEALVEGCGSPWTMRLLRTLGRHSERYRCIAIRLGPQPRDVHAEHRLIYELAMSGQEARAALALEAHIRATPDALAQAGWGGPAPVTA